MKKSNKVYGIGCLLALLGGAGLAEISTSSHGSFVICAALFSVGFAMCIWSYKL